MIQGSTRPIPIGQVRESETNPRRHFNEEKLQELAASIREQGVLQAVTVRPIAGSDLVFELVIGARRFRAAKIAGLSEIPASVRELSDVQALEVQLIENNQRDDLTAIEEAEGFKALISKGYDAAKIAARIGRSVKYVYDRVKLLQLAKAPRKLLEEGIITPGHAILLARLKTDDQLRAIDVESGGVFTDQHALSLEESDEPIGISAFKPVSVRELEGWIDEHVRLEPNHKELPTLFPDTAEAIEKAKAEKQKVVLIARYHQVPKDARAGDRILTERSWKRADGEIEPSEYSQKPTKTCEHSVMGFVAVGPGRGEAFLVCVDKVGCKVHWSREQKARAEAKAERETAPKDDRGAKAKKAAEETLKKEASDRADALMIANLVKGARELPLRKVLEVLIVESLGVADHEFENRWPMPKGVDRYRTPEKVLNWLGTLEESDLKACAFDAIAFETAQGYSNGGAIAIALGVRYKETIAQLEADILKELKAKATEAAKAAPAPKAKRAKSKKTTKAKRKKKAAEAAEGDA